MIEPRAGGKVLRCTMKYTLIFYYAHDVLLFSTIEYKVKSQCLSHGKVSCYILMCFLHSIKLSFHALALSLSLSLLQKFLCSLRWTAGTTWT